MTTTTPDMGLILPDVSVTAGPQWATLLNAALTAIDSHNHSTGQGVAINPSGLNINADLTFAQNNATNLRSARLFNNSSFSAGVNDLTCLYALNNELYYRDGAGNTIQFTSGGFLNLSANISSLTIKDTSFFIENFSDITKQMRFNVSAIPTATTRILSVPDSGANDTFVTQTATQTLTNKTLSGNVAATLVSSSGVLTLNTSGTITVPNSTDTLVGKATTDTLTNKSFNNTTTILAANKIQFNNSGNTFSTSLQAGSNAANVSFLLPITDGSANQVMKTNGSGQLGWATAQAFSRGDVATTATITALSSSNSLIRLTGSTATLVQGIAAGAAAAQLLVLNVSTAEVQFANQNGSATAANRIITASGATVSIQPNWSAQFVYDDSQSRWVLTNTTCLQEWVGYTPTISAGFGTASAIAFSYKVSGDSLFIKGSFTSGTNAATTGNFTTPSGFTISTSKLTLNNTSTNPGNIVGSAAASSLSTGQATYLVTAPSTSTVNVYFGGQLSGASILTPAAGNAIFSSNSTVVVECEVPIV